VRMVMEARKVLVHRLPQFLSLGVLGISVVAGFAVTYMIGHNLGLAATGQYALIMQTAMFLAVFGLFGLDQSAVRHFSKAVAERKLIALPLLLRFLAIGFGMMAAIIAVLLMGGERVWTFLFDGAVGLDLLPVLCLMIIGRGGALLMNGLLRSQHRFGIGVAVTGIFMPTSAALALLTGLATSVKSALLAAALGSVVAVAVGLVALNRHIGKGPDTTDIALRTIFASSLPLWGVGLIQVFNDWYSLTIAARFLSAEDAGLLRVGIQVAAPMQMVAGALFAVYAAQISAAFHAGDRNGAAKLARSAVVMSSALVLPLALVILLSGRFLLALIGPEFVAAYPVMAILVIGQIAFTLTGPCGLLLAMSGNERVNLAISVLGTVSLVVAVPIAAAAGGLETMAICLALVMLARNGAAFLIVRYRVGIRIWAGKAEPAREIAPSINSSSDLP
jgi:O-antigen/teichoic acid export membrane protein